MRGALVWFDPRGRLSRRAYGRLVVRLALVSAVCLCLAIAAAGHGERVPSLILAVCATLPWIASLAQTIRRLHDRGRTGWWLAVYLILAALGFVPIERAVDTYSILVTGYALASLAFSLWFLIETLGRRGMDGPNRYGSEPPSC